MDTKVIRKVSSSSSRIHGAADNGGWGGSNNNPRQAYLAGMRDALNQGKQSTVCTKWPIPRIHGTLSVFKTLNVHPSLDLPPAARFCSFAQGAL